MPTSNITPAGPNLRFAFYLGPFRFDSEIEIPELRATTGPGERLASIRLGGVPDGIPGAVSAGPGCWVSACEYLLEIPGTARYYVRNGNEVRLEIVPGTPLPNVTTYLLGSIFGALCHQNGLLPLHASAIGQAGRVTAFLGDSGAGKSTLAACLRERGHTIISDDICLLEQTEGRTRVIPVAGWLKLWNQSLEYLGKAPQEEHRVFSTDDKFRVYLPGAPANPPATLERLVFLARDDAAAAQPALLPLPLLDGIAGLMEFTYAAWVPVLSGSKSRLFQQCAQLMQHATAWRLAMPWGLERMPSVIDLLEREILR